MKKQILVATLLLGFSSAWAQRQFRPLHAEADFLDKGWSVALGSTAMLPLDFRKNVSLYSTAARDSSSLVYDGKLTSTPKAGWMLDVHRVWLKTKFKYFDYWEAGGRYYALRGMERFNGDYPGKNSNGILSSDLKTKFTLHTIGIDAKAIDMWQISDTKWIHHGPIVYADYQFVQSTRKKGVDLPIPYSMPYRFQSGLNYQLGIGKKFFPGFYALGTIETPLLTIVPWREKWPTMSVLDTKWQPVMATIKIVFLDKRPSKACENRPNAMEEFDKDNPGKHNRKNGVMEGKIKRVKVKKRD